MATKIKKRKVLTPEQIAIIGLQRQTKARNGLYKVILKTIKKFKNKNKPYYFICDNDINNVLATLIKNSTDGNN